MRSTPRGRRSTACAAAIGTVVALALSACGSDGDTQHHLFLTDASRSGDRAGLVDLTDDAVRGAVANLAPGDSITVVGFSAFATANCPAIEIRLEEGLNEDKAADHREAFAALIDDGAIRRLRDCLRDPDTGSAAAGSAIFSGVVEATASTGDFDTLTAITDGLDVSQGLPRSRRATDPEAYVDTLEEEGLVPDLSGVDLTWLGLGQGKRMSGQLLVRLRDLFQAYGERADAASITFHEGA
jgi:hypothetical protein